MPRIIVMADPIPSDLAEETPVLLDEQVRSVHLSTNHAASQLVERLAWAVSDAEKAEIRRSELPTPSRLHASEAQVSTTRASA